MFQRGQKVVILESSASRRSHPSVGDVGYLSNMYLFFKDRFILLDIFFLAYKSDIKNGKDRCEKKRFLVDLGIAKKLKYKLRQTGMPRKFFIRNPYVANLASAGYLFDEHSYMESPTTQSTWARMHNKQGKNLLNTCVKIPYGQIAVIPHAKRPLNKESTNTVRCWISSLAPLLAAKMGPFANNEYGSDVRTVYTIASSMYYSRLGEILRNGIDINDKNVPGAIKDLRMIQVLSGSFLDKCDENLLRDRGLARHRGTVNIVWGAKKSIEALIGNNKISKSIADALVGMFFRSILTTRDTKGQLLKMKAGNFLPWPTAVINAKSKRLEEIKLKANSSSAALNRIFEEKLF